MTGLDKISNIHLKHLGHNAILAITQVFNHSWLYNSIPAIWKQTHVIPLLKPNKPPTHPSSFRPISLLCTLSKLLERLICTRIKPQLPTSHTQHGFKKEHYTTTLLKNLIQNILDGFNQNHPHYKRALLAMIDINKAFDTMPKHILQQKVLSTTLHTNYKKLAHKLPV